jgi:hypothetical membrane protein
VSWSESIPTLAGGRRLRIIAVSAGILGPVCFVGGWLAAAALRPNFSSTQQAISQLAREGAPHRLLMTGAFFAFGIAMPFFAQPLSRALEGGRSLRAAVILAGLATLAVACCPLSVSGSGTRDLVHGSFATTGYVAMVASAALGAVALNRRQRALAARVAAAVAVVATGCLAMTTAGLDVGLFQRAGLTVVDVWFVVMAITILRDNSGVCSKRVAGIRP